MSKGRGPNQPIDGIRGERPSSASDSDGVGQRPSERPEAEGGVRSGREGFQRPLPSHLSRISRQIMQHMDGAVGALALKLPGLARIIRDRRITEDMKAAAEAARGEGAAESGKKEFQIKDGQVRDLKQKTYDNYLAARQMAAPKQGEGAAPQERALSEFEKLLLARFEGGKELEQAIKDGKFKFLEKTVEQWRAFFEKFAGRTSEKNVSLEEIQAFLFRGLVKKDASKAILISDIIQNSGKTDKFARFSVLYQKLSSFLSGLVPGDRISKKALSEGLTSEELLYLAIQPPSGETELLTGMKPKQGIFSSEATEARIAEELGISTDKGAFSSAGDKSILGRGKKKKAGFLAGLFGGDEEPVIEDRGQFIPWWSWGTLNRPGGLKVKRAFYSGVIIIFILLVLFIVDRLLR